MKNTFERIFAVVIVLAFIVGLAACAKPADPVTTTTQPATSESTTPETTAATAPAATEPEGGSKWDQFSLDMLPQTPDARLSVQEVSCPEYDPETEWAVLLGCRGDVALWNLRTIVSHRGDMSEGLDRPPDPMRLVLFNVRTGETLVEMNNQEVTDWDYAQLYRDDALLLVKNDADGLVFSSRDQDGSKVLFTAEQAENMTFTSFENGDIVYAYGNRDTSHGIRMFSGGALRDIRTWEMQTGENGYLGFGLDTYGDSFACPYQRDGRCRRHAGLFLQKGSHGFCLDRAAAGLYLTDHPARRAAQHSYRPFVGVALWLQERQWL